MTTPTIAPYKLGPVKSHVSAAASELGARHGIRTVYGYRANGGVPNSDHPKGLALDFMTSNLPNGRTVGDALSADAVANRTRLGVTYVIWWGQIWTASQGWHRYTLPNQHTDHVHVSFSSGGGDNSIPFLPGDLIPSGVTIPGLGDARAMYEQISKMIQWLTEPGNWKRIGLFAGGSALVLAALLRASGTPGAIVQGAKTVAGAAGKVVKRG